jgi:hypothetical protein
MMFIIVDHDAQHVECVLAASKEGEEVLIDGVCLVIIYYPHFERFCEIKNGTILYFKNVLDGQRDLYAVAFIVRTKDHLLDRSNPFFRTHGAISFELVCPLVSSDDEYSLIFALVFGFQDFGGDCILQVDAIPWKV